MAFKFLSLALMVASASAGFLSTGFTPDIYNHGPSIDYLHTPVKTIIPAIPTKVQNVYTQSGRTHIRVEEHQDGPQILRVHEQPARAPEVINVQTPNYEHSTVRVINKPGPVPTAERIVHRSNQAYITDVTRPAGPPVRIVQHIKGPASAPYVEYYNADTSPGSVSRFDNYNTRFYDYPSPSARYVPAQTYTQTGYQVPTASLYPSHQYPY